MGEFLDTRGDESFDEWVRRNLTHNIFRVAMKLVRRGDYLKMRAGLDRRMGRSIAYLQGRDQGLEIAQHRCNQTYFEVIKPGRVAADAPVVLYLHGGGYFMGSAHAYRRIVTYFAKKLGVRMVLLDYRLAPEHPYPAALNDAHDVFRWIRENLNQLPMVMGDSAGGGLALALSMQLRDQGEDLPGKVVCLSPWTDLTCSGASFDSNDSTDLMLDAAHTREVAKYYIGDQDPTDPLISPVFGSFEGLPKTFVLVSDLEILLDDATRIFQKASASGMPIKMHVYENMQHVWPIPFPHLAESKIVLAQIKEFLHEDLN